MKDMRRSLKTQVLLSLVLLTVVSSTVCSANELEVPYYTQDGSGWCWATSLSMVLEFYGYEIKPWRIAADFNKGFDIGPTLFGQDEIHYYLENLFNDGYSDAWNFIAFWTSSNLKSTIYSVISSGHPFYLNIHYTNPDTGNEAAHAIVITGCTGIGDNDFITFHDPSGAFTGDADDVVYSSSTWDEFLNKLDFTFLFIKAYGIHARPDKLIPFSDRGPLSVEVEPQKLYFDLEGGGIPKSIFLMWDGIEPYNGYRYQPSPDTIGLWPADDDGDTFNYAYKTIQTSTLNVKPTYSYHPLTSSNISFRYRYSIYNNQGGALVTSWPSPVSPAITEATTGNLDDQYNDDQYNYVLPMCELPEGVYELEVAITDESGVQVYDKCSFKFGVVWEGDPVEVRPSPPTTTIKLMNGLSMGQCMTIPEQLVFLLI